ncbi:hypothetical protein ACH5RR_037802 [Cinchona calisaya]|uniref:BHLH domain-containing protein n=1 Tax=Cinchona calisaya TaxID=153742 RepID=A0ABD2Y780_9GENT
MADEFQLGSGNWWDLASSRNRFEHSGSTTAAAAAAASVNSNNMGISSFGWPTEIVAAAHQSSSEKLQAHNSSSSSGGGLLPTDPNNLQITGLALSSQTMNWNQPALFSREEKGETSFRSMLQDEASTNFQQESTIKSSQDHQWRHKLYARSSPDESSVITDCKPVNRRSGISLDESYNYSQVDSASYANTPNNVLLVPDHHHQQPQELMNYSYPSSYGMETTWSKFPQFLRNTSPPKHFSNNVPFWNASSAGMNDVRSSLFPALQTQVPVPNFEEKKPKNISGVRDLAVAKKSSSSNSEPSNKRPRNATPAPMPAFKVRKEKMGDRITALQQLVSPFGKTDTASVLSEVNEYIKFLHDQVNNLVVSKDPHKQDLRSRGLCLVPVSSTFPVTQETTVDYWTPTFGGTFR